MEFKLDTSGKAVHEIRLVIRQLCQDRQEPASLPLRQTHRHQFFSCNSVSKAAAFWSKNEAQLVLLGWGPRLLAVTSNGANGAATTATADGSASCSRELQHPYMQHLSNVTVLSTGEFVGTARDWDTCT